MDEFYRKLIARYEMKWENPRLQYNQFYATPDLYYGQSYPPEEIRRLAALMEKACREAGLPPEISTGARHGTTIHLFNAETEPVPVEITLTGGKAPGVLNPVVA